MTESEHNISGRNRRPKLMCGERHEGQYQAIAADRTLFAVGRVGDDVGCPEIEDTSSSCCCVGCEESRGGVGQRKFGLQLAGSKGSSSTVGIHTLAGYTTPRVRVIESFGFNSPQSTPATSHRIS